MEDLEQNGDFAANRVSRKEAADNDAALRQDHPSGNLVTRSAAIHNLRGLSDEALATVGDQLENLDQDVSPEDLDAARAIYDEELSHRVKLLLDEHKKGA